MTWTSFLKPGATSSLRQRRNLKPRNHAASMSERFEIIVQGESDDRGETIRGIRAMLKRLGRNYGLRVCHLPANQRKKRRRKRRSELLTAGNGTQMVTQYNRSSKPQSHPGGLHRSPAQVNAPRHSERFGIAVELADWHLRRFLAGKPMDAEIVAFQCHERIGGTA